MQQPVNAPGRLTGNLGTTLGLRIGALAEGIPGLPISNVVPGSLVADVGLQAGDRILAVGGQVVQSVDDWQAAILERAGAGQPVPVRIQRGEAAQEIVLPADRLQEQLAGWQNVSIGIPNGGALGLSLDRAAFPQAIVSEVAPRGPAEVAGIQVGDQIVALNGIALESAEQLLLAVSRARVGDQFLVNYRRSDNQFQAAMPLVRYESIAGQGGSPQDRGAALGIRVVQNAQGRIVVSAIEVHSPAAIAGIRVGDEIVAVQGTPVATPAHLAAFIDRMPVGQNVDLVVRRGQEEFRASPRSVAHAELFGTTPAEGSATERQVMRQPVEDTGGEPSDQESQPE